MSLPGWARENRVLFMIEGSLVPGDEILYDYPLLFALTENFGLSDTDITYIFNSLAENNNSNVNKLKIAITQLVNGQELQCFAEIISWNHFAKQAFIWFRTHQLSPEHNSLFYFYYDKGHADNLLYIEESNSDRSNIITIKASTGNSYFPLAVLKVNTIYKLYYLFNNDSYGLLESVDLTTWADKGTVLNLTDSLGKATILYDESTNLYKMWSVEKHTDWGVYYRTSTDGLSWSSETLVVSNDEYYYNRMGISCATVYKNDTGYIMLYSINFYKTKLMYAESSDGVFWSNFRLLADLLDYDNHISNIFPLAVYQKTIDLFVIMIEIVSGSKHYLISLRTKDFFTTFNLDYFVRCFDACSNGQRHYASYSLNTIEHHLFWSGTTSSDYTIVTCKSSAWDKPVTPSQNVWVEHCCFVNHMSLSQGLTDSTHNHADTLSYSNMSITTGFLGTPAVNFDNSTSKMTFENYNYTNKLGGFGTILFLKYNQGRTIYTNVETLYNDIDLTLTYNNEYFIKVQDLPQDSWQVVGISHKYSSVASILDTSYEDEFSYSYTYLAPIFYQSYLGNTSNAFEGVIDEVFSFKRNLFEGEVDFLTLVFKDQIFSVGNYYIEGSALIDNRPVSRTITCYNRANGELMGFTTSDSSTGHYKILTTYSGAHFVVGIDGDMYNHYILGSIIPKHL
jgi:hypothetical protein